MIKKMSITSQKKKNKEEEERRKKERSTIMNTNLLNHIYFHVLYA
jgi:hypothetical protein